MGGGFLVWTSVWLYIKGAPEALRAAFLLTHCRCEADF